MSEAKMGNPRSATFRVSTHQLFELMDLYKFSGHIDKIELDPETSIVTMLVSGVDRRLPDRKDYPRCMIISDVAAHLKVMP
jgi:hypothetical protein